ncbi:hypothetical protein KAJ27_22680 [bacterium]|nr:hypothetical protein [bacterium]
MKIKLRIQPHKDYLINREADKIKLIIRFLILVPVVFALFLGYKYFSIKNIKEQSFLQRSKHYQNADKMKKEFVTFKTTISKFKSYRKKLGKMEKYFSYPIIVKCVGKIEECLDKVGIVKHLNLTFNEKKHYVSGNLNVEFNDVANMTKSFGRFVSESDFIAADIVEISLVDPCSFKINLKFMEKTKELTTKDTK